MARLEGTGCARLGLEKLTPDHECVIWRCVNGGLGIEGGVSAVYLRVQNLAPGCGNFRWVFISVIYDISIATLFEE